MFSISSTSGVKKKYWLINEFCKVDRKMDKPLEAVISTGKIRNKLPDNRITSDTTDVISVSARCR